MILWKLFSVQTSYFFPISLWFSLGYYFWKRWSSPPAIDLFSISETIVFLFGCLNLCFLWIGSHLSKNQSMKEEEENLPFLLSPWPKILILIPTYKESKNILESTFNSFSELDYDHEQLTIVVSDDGARDWLHHWITTSFPHFHYYCRYNNDHAKAGNLNHILFHPMFSHCTDFVLILDADMNVHPKALYRLLRPFYKYECSQWTFDSSIIFVQGPQQFSNIQGIDWLGQHYLFFYQVVLPAYDGFSLGVPCCGTNVLFHLPTFRHLGGFQYGSITEDFLTSLYFHSLGKKSRYTTQTIATGLAPYTFFDFFQQRKRWIIGGFQIIFHPYFLRRWFSLPLSHKWIYSLSATIPCLSFCLLVLIMEVFYSFDSFPHQPFWIYTFIYLFGLFFLLRHQSFLVTFVSISESLYMIFYNLIFFVSFFLQSIRCQKILFYSTPKENMSSLCHSFYSFLLLSPFLLYLGIGTGFFYFFSRFESFLPTLWFILINLQFGCPIFYCLQSLTIS